MPRYWYDRSSIFREFDDEDIRKFQLSIAADKKPYFMRYIYPALMKDYNAYIKNVNMKCIMEFKIRLEDLLQKDPDSLTKQERDFVWMYHFKMPVGTNDSVMNRICRKVEDIMSGYISEIRTQKRFDYSILKSNVGYTKHQYYDIRKLYLDHLEKLKSISQDINSGSPTDEELHDRRRNMIQQFSVACIAICPRVDRLCDIVLDVCYKKEGTKQFAWDVAGTQIINNMLKRSNGIIRYPYRDDNGSISYGGARFSVKELELRYENEYSIG